MKKFTCLLVMIIALFNGIQGQTFFGDEDLLVETEVGNSNLTHVDIDQDGDIDIVMSTGYKIVWFENIAENGHFSEKIIITSSINAAYGTISVVDFDNDGDLDIVANNNRDDKIVWFKNTDGNANFSEEIIITSIGVDSIRTFKMDDIDGDGDLDIIIKILNQIMWLENLDGLGTFGVAQPFAVNVSIYTFITGDVDNDGDIDVITTSYNEIVWYENINGLGLFGNKIVIEENAGYCYSISLKDIDNDGFKDLVADVTLNSELVWFKNTNGTFSPKTIINATNSTSFLNVTDFDSDGDYDILAINTGGSIPLFYENSDGHGTFALPVELTTDDEKTVVYAFDIDNDMDNDIITAGSGKYLAWNENIDGGTSFSSEIRFTYSLRIPIATMLEDLNNDGYKDLITACEWDNRIVYYPFDVNNPNFYDQFTITNSAKDLTMMDANDINNDGFVDIVIVSENEDLIAWYMNDGLGHFSVQDTISSSVTRPKEILFKDLDGDNDLDILCSFVNELAWFRNLDGNGNFGEKISLSTYTDACGAITVGDYDNDGDIDIISGLRDLFFYENINNVGFMAGQMIRNLYNEDIIDLSSADMNNDGNIDIVMTHRYMYANGYFAKIDWMDYSDGDIAYSDIKTIVNTTTTSMFYEMEINDIDGDGDIDVIASENFSNDIYTTTRYIRWFENTNNGQDFPYHTIDNTGSDNPNIHIADVNSDNKIDIISILSDEDRVHWYENSPSPKIVVQPTAQTTCPNSATTISISGMNVSEYQWQVNEGYGFMDISNTTYYSGFQSSTLTILNADISQDGNYYRCVITNPASTVNSNSALLTVQDLEDPVINSTHTDKSLIASDNCDVELPDYTLSVNASDNCDTDLEITQSPVAGTLVSGAVNEVTITVTDNVNNTAQVTFNVEVLDQTDPTLSFSDQTIYAADNCEAALPDFSTSITASDNCDGELDYTQIPPAGVMISGIINTVQVEVTDDAGNSSSTTINVTVVDTTKPAITSLHEEQLIGDGIACEVSLPDFTGDLTATDNCDGTLDVVQTPAAGTMVSGDLNMVTLTVEDDDLNSSSVNFNVKVSDTSAPVISSTHDDVSLDADANCQAEIPDYIPSIVATDNCDTELEYVQSPAAGEIISGLINVITLTATDDTDNSSDVTFNIEVVDNTAPSVTLEDQTLVADGNCEATLPDYTLDAVVADNCDADVTLVQNPLAGTGITGATNSVTITATDDNGNENQVIINVAVLDETAPVITSTHNDIELDADANCQASLPDYTADIVASDACDTELDVTQSPTAGTLISGATNEITLTVTDDAGNSTDVIFNIVVNDNTAPVLTFEDQVIDANDDCQASLPDYTTEITASDNCDSDLTLNQTPVAGTLISGVDNIVTISTTDAAGNPGEVTFNVVVEDNTYPTISSTHNDIVLGNGLNCEESLPDFTTEVTATDNCDSELQITQSPAAGTMVYGSDNTITLTVTDNDGNFSEVSFNVSIEDTTDPTITCVGNQEVDADESHTYVVVGAEFDPTETDDNCGVASIVNDFNSHSTLDGAALPEGITTITWTTTDESGNSSSCSFDINVAEYIGINENITNKLIIYPNPTTGVVAINFKDSQIVINTIERIIVTDINGKVVFNETTIEENQTIDLSGFSNGTYFIKIITQTDNYVNKIIKQ